MSVSDWLTLGALVATVAFGILGLQHIRSPDPVFVGLAVVSLLFAAATYWHSNRPPFTVLDKKYDVVIDDPQGTSATFRKAVELRPNHGHLQQYTHRNLTCDGAFEDIRVNGRVERMPVREIAGDTHVPVRFPYALPRFKTTQTWIETDLTDAFTSPRERAILLVDEPTKRLQVCIDLPEDRSAREVWAVYRYSGDEEELHDPVIDKDRNEISWEHSRSWGRTLPNGEYEIGWLW